MLSLQQRAPLLPLILATLCALALSAGVTGQESGPDAVAGPRFVDAFEGQADFDRPLYLDWHPDDPDHYWVCEQGGRIFRIPRDGDDGAREVVLDISERCLHPGNGGHNEEGLLGFAFDPDWGAGSRAVYVYYSREISRKPGKKRPKIVRESIIARYQTVADEDAGPRIDPGSEEVLMRIAQPWGNHNGGTIVFGPDRMLYIALGDGGAANDRGGNGQNLSTWLGAILRIDVHGKPDEGLAYRVPGDNPFVDRPDARGEIWAFGLRNPWRISFDRETGELWCGDVGQNLWEEVDRIEKGGNYGWPLREGRHEFPPDRDTEDDPDDLIEPVAEYSHKGEGISITGGYVYRGSTHPDLHGRYVYGDFAFMTLWAAMEDRVAGEHSVIEIGKAPAALASFAEEPDGALLLLCFDGRIYRLDAPAD